MTFEDCGELGEAIEVFLEAFARAFADPATLRAALQPTDAGAPAASRPAGDFFDSLGQRLATALMAGPSLVASVRSELDCSDNEAQRVAWELARLATVEARKAVNKRMGSGALTGIPEVRQRAQEARLSALLDAGVALPDALSAMGISRATGYRTLARLRARGVSI